MLKETETVSCFVSFLSLVAFQLGGGGELASPDGLATPMTKSAINASGFKKCLTGIVSSNVLKRDLTALKYLPIFPSIIALGFGEVKFCLGEGAPLS